MRGKKKACTPGQANLVLVNRIRDSLAICNTYYFSTVTVVTRTRLNVKVIRTLPVGVMYKLSCEMCFCYLCQTPRVWRTITESHLLDNFVTECAQCAHYIPHAQDKEASCRRKVVLTGRSRIVLKFRVDDHSFSSVDKKNQLDVTFCILYFSSNSCSTCFGQPCAHHQELTTA